MYCTKCIFIKHTDLAQLFRYSGETANRDIFKGDLTYFEETANRDIFKSDLTYFEVGLVSILSALEDFKYFNCNANIQCSQDKGTATLLNVLLRQKPISISFLAHMRRSLK